MDLPKSQKSGRSLDLVKYSLLGSVLVTLGYSTPTFNVHLTSKVIYGLLCVLPLLYHRPKRIQQFPIDNIDYVVWMANLDFVYSVVSYLVSALVLSNYYMPGFNF